MRHSGTLPALAFALLAALAVTGCKSRPSVTAVENQNKNLLGTLAAKQERIDDLTAAKVSLDRRVKELEAQLAKVKSTETVVEEATLEISEHVRQMLDRFRGDSDIEIEPTKTGYRFVLREAVLFATGSETLTPDGRRALQRVADSLRGGNERISIEGHTDDVPVKKPETLKKFPRGNIELSVERALSVWGFLSKEGKVDAGRMSVVGHGATQPRVPNTSETNKWRNRRVEILVESR